MTFSVLQSVDSYKKIDGAYEFNSADSVYFTKRVTTSGSTPVSHAYKFKLVEDFNPNSLDELMPRILEWSEDPHKMAIRYRYLNHRVGEEVLRRAIEVKPVVSNIVAMDVDEIPVPSSLDNTDIVGMGKYICDLLTKCDESLFPEDMGFIVQGSSSVGITDKVKIHMFFENYWALTQEQLKQMFWDVNNKFKRIANVTFNLIDTALYNPVQPHYIASPLFDGVIDPMKGLSRIQKVVGEKMYIPENVPSYVRNVRITDENIFIDSIDARDTIPNAVSMFIDVIKAWDKEESGLRTKVIATYHRAWQSSYSLDLLGKELKPIIEELRPEMSDDYISQGRNACIQAFVRSSKRDLPYKVLGVDLETIEAGSLDLFLDIKDPPPDNSITFLKASLGTGKTHTIENWLRGGRIFGRFLTITDTSSLVESNANRFAAGDFRSPKARLDFATDKITNLSGTLHSLWKIKPFSHRFDFVFIDEADSVLNTLLFSNLISEEKKTMIIEVLHDLFRCSNRIVLSDGDLSEESVKQYCDLFEFCKKVYRVNHQRETLKGANAYQHISENSLWGALQSSLSELKGKCLLVSDCSPDKLNEKRLLLNNLTGAKIKVVHSNSKKDTDIAEIINETTEALKRQNIDCLLCSPSITNGVDFNYFDNVFVLTTTDSHTPNLRYQALRRDRRARTIHYYFHNFKGYTTGYKEVLYNEGWINTARRDIALRRERECKNYINTFQYYLMIEGAHITVVNDPYKQPNKVVQKEVKEQYKYERIMAVYEATPYVIQQTHNDAYELQQATRNYYNVDGDITIDDVTQFLAQRPDKAAAFFHLLFNDFWGDISKCVTSFEPFRQALESRGATFYLKTGKQARAGKGSAKMYMNMCGIEDPGDFNNITDWYRKYCILESFEIPDIFKDNEEVMSELRM